MDSISSACRIQISFLSITIPVKSDLKLPCTVHMQKDVIPTVHACCSLLQLHNVRAVLIYCYIVMFYGHS